MVSIPRFAMILAAGFGTRLRPLTDSCPKALIEVAGRPMIEYPLRMLAAAGVEVVVINLHHGGELIRSALGDGNRYGVRILYSPEDPILDTGGAIQKARPMLGAGSFAVLNCDTLLEVDLEELARFHEERSALATLVVRRDPAAHRYGPLDLEPSGRIRRFLGLPEDGGSELERRMFCGVHVLSSRIFDFMPRYGIFSITRDTYASAHRAGAPLFGFRYDGYWKDLGTAAALEEARDDVRRGRFTPRYLLGQTNS